MAIFYLRCAWFRRRLVALLEPGTLALGDGCAAHGLGFAFGELP
jgi:hypothetical protein